MNWWHYLLLVNFYLVIFFAFYAVLLRKETFFNLNRIFLVSATGLSFLIPLIQASWVKNLFITQQVQHTLYIAYSMPITIYGQPVEKLITVGEILGYLYMVIAALLIVKLFWSLLVLKKQIEKPDPSVAYSFFKKISLGKDMANADVIAEHEQVHARQWHSIDVLLIELTVIINWFNPVVYLYRFAIKYIHEFIADREVLKTGTDKADYALLLLSQTFDVPNHHLASNFYNTSLLKQRIAMLQKNRSNRIALIKYGLSAPLFMLMLILSSATVNDSTVLKSISKKAENVFLTPASETAAMITDLPKEILAKPVHAVVEPDNSNVIIPDQNSTKNNIEEPTPVTTDTPKVGNAVNRVYMVVEVLPSFPGGPDAFNQYLAANLRYPKEDRDKSVQGKVIVQFTVETDGSLTDIRSVRAPSQAMAEEAIRVLKTSPAWRPGVQNGKSVRAQFTQSISFTLIDEKGGPLAPAAKVYEVVEVLPQFPGGADAFNQFLQRSIRYPAADRENNIQGKVVLQFVVEADGSITNIRSIRSPTPAMAAEAVRVMTLSPAWKPGIQDGKAVRSQFTQTVSFTLGNDRPAAPAVDFMERAMNAVSGSRGKILIMVDGVECDNIPAIEQSDISYMSIQGPMQAKQTYGDKGANGALVITTKSKKGETLKKVINETITKPKN